jgi:hypothetical protein
LGIRLPAFEAPLRRMLYRWRRGAYRGFFGCRAL